jgi:tryptophanyl-tRNA synthetase
MAEPEAPTQEVPAAAQVPAAPAPNKQIVDPWNVAGEIGEDGKAKAIDYNKLVEEFGTKLIDAELLERFERVTGHKPHRFLRRKIVFSERDLGLILDRYEKVRGLDSQPWYAHSVLTAV